MARKVSSMYPLTSDFLQSEPPNNATLSTNSNSKRYTGLDYDTLSHHWSIIVFEPKKGYYWWHRICENAILTCRHGTGSGTITYMKGVPDEDDGVPDATFCHACQHVDAPKITQANRRAIS
jgi:hypothetical protein